MTRPIYLGIGFGHTATLEKSESGAAVTVRGPRGVPPVVVDVIVTAEGTTIRMRDTILHRSSSPPPSETALPPPVDTPRNTGLPPSANGALLPLPAAPAATESSFEPRLSVQQYASLRAECVSAKPDKLAEIRARYALDEASDSAEAEAWARRFASDAMVFETYRRLFQMFRGARPAVPVPPSEPRPPSSGDGLSTEAFARMLTLGQHATMVVELLHSPPDAVYAKYGLSDGEVRSQVLRACEARLKDPHTLDRWKQLRDLVIRNLETARA